MPKKKHIHDIQDEQAFFIDALETVHSDKPEDWRVTLCTNGKGINYKLDTGSQVNILLEKQYYSLRWKPKLHQTNIQLMSYSKHSIPVLGACVLEVTHLGKAAKVYFVIVQDASTAILGVQACDKGTDMSTKLTKSAQEEDLKVYVDSVIKSLPIKDRKLQMIREETQNDPKLQLLAEVIVTGFPETRTECP
uniref:Retropepsins domain-containing protein n=1 Tax=Magallana gigas TaxID=29159 RepID=A0A8W8HU78_MAGGI